MERIGDPYEAPQGGDEDRDRSRAGGDGVGDTGRTVLGGHGDLAKHDVRVSAHDECDAANAAVAVAMAIGALPDEVNAMLVSVQNDLFDLGADLLEPLESAPADTVRIIPEHVERLERAIEHYRVVAGDLSGMALPGGTVGAAFLYQARAAVRQAERVAWLAVERHPESVNAWAPRYLNRLSTLLFVLARGANAEHGDVLWEPGASVRPMLDEKRLDEKRLDEKRPDERRPDEARIDDRPVDGGQAGS
ncbi:cob(I)yrinic acid a,c-diamide adenosyltransferase [Zafaria cholistanensis]|nr:cob(I)yrinic acid a,c-diamide adenosyltransferase [Zafaria cholistanensis]